MLVLAWDQSPVEDASTLENLCKCVQRKYVNVYGLSGHDQINKPAQKFGTVGASQVYPYVPRDTYAI